MDTVGELWSKSSQISSKAFFKSEKSTSIPLVCPSSFNWSAALQAEEFRMIEVGFRPTAEHFSKYFYELMSAKGFPIHRVEVYETPIM